MAQEQHNQPPPSQSPLEYEQVGTSSDTSRLWTELKRDDPDLARVVQTEVSIAGSTTAERMTTKVSILRILHAARISEERRKFAEAIAGIEDPEYVHYRQLEIFGDTA